MSIVTLFVGCSHLGCATLKANSSTCMSHLKQVALGVAMYAQDNDERLPPASHWAEVIAPQLKQAKSSFNKPGEDIFRCPSAETPAAYGMNAVMGSVSYSEIDTPYDTLLLFEADAPIRSFEGGAAQVARERHSGAPNFAFTDGHAKWVNSNTIEQLNWNPKPVKATR